MTVRAACDKCCDAGKKEEWGGDLTAGSQSRRDVERCTTVTARYKLLAGPCSVKGWKTLEASAACQ